MFWVEGKFGKAKIYSDLVEPSAVSQVVELLNQPYAEGGHVRMMPDIHAGAGCTIGTTMYIKDRICPNLVGVDIGCGMLTARIAETSIDLEKLDQTIREYIPSGHDVRDVPHGCAKELADLSNLRCKQVDMDRAYRSIGTLGGGNHFIEVDRSEDGKLYIVIHSGSRNAGKQVATAYQEMAWKQITGQDKDRRDAVIQQLKAEGRQSEIEQALKGLKPYTCKTPKELAYLEGQLFDDYIHDMEIMQRFAEVNRAVMLDQIVTHMGLSVEDKFQTIHNYIDTEYMILRKGAVSAQKGEKLLIPINMRDGSLICVGKGDPAWNFSAPHGAGRLLSRSAAKESCSMEEYRETMQGIYSTSIDPSTLDECPMAYKPILSILENIKPTVDVIEHIKPIYNFKAAV